MFGWIKAALNVAVGVVKLIKGTDHPVTLADVLPTALTNLLPAVNNAIDYQGFNTKDKFDSWLETVDRLTGVEPTAVDLIKGLPADKEEELFDHLKEAARIYGYNRIGVDGYVG